jgi:hypothetical protein
VADDGEGIFLKIQRAPSSMTRAKPFSNSPRASSPRTRQSLGRGHFFASKVFDAYDIRSGRLHFMHGRNAFDVLMERPPMRRGRWSHASRQ